MPLEAHYDRFVLRCGSCGEELTKPGRIAPLPEAGAAGWGLIVEPNGTYDYACSACLATILQTCTYSPQNRQDVSVFALTYSRGLSALRRPMKRRVHPQQRAGGYNSMATRCRKLVSQRVIDLDQN